MEISQNFNIQSAINQNSSINFKKVLNILKTEDVENFQKSLNEKKIIDIWKAFRESGNPHEGKLTRKIFKMVCVNQLGENDPSFKNDFLIESIFDRFKMDRYSESSREEDKIELQDLLISLTILSRISQERKLSLIFRLTDVADDGCLSKKAILKMISRIERNFAKENCPIEINSSTILQEMANKKAQRKYRLLMQKLDLDKANIENKQEADEDFITYEEFLDALKKRDELYKSFLPDNQQMIKVLSNTNSEFLVQVSDQFIDDIDDFRKKLHSLLRKDDIQSAIYVEEQKMVKYPGKIESLGLNQQKIILSNIDRRSNITVLRNNKEKLLGTNKYLLHHSGNFIERQDQREKDIISVFSKKRNKTNISSIDKSESRNEKLSPSSHLKSILNKHIHIDTKTEPEKNLNLSLHTIPHNENQPNLEKHRKRLNEMVQTGEKLNSEYKFIRLMRKNI